MRRSKYSFYEKGDKEHSFINPYTFIPLDGSANSASTSAETQGSVSDVSEDDDKIVTGKLTCRLNLKTPLIIPDPDNSEPDQTNVKHYRYPFMKIGADYIIPGSSIRGPVRSVYETVTNSCMSTMQKRQKITARTNDAFSPGVLFYRNGEMKLFAADRYRVYMSRDLWTWDYGEHLVYIGYTKKKRIHYAKKIIGRYPIKTEIITDDEVKDGYLFLGERFGNRKKYESIFVLKNGGAALSSCAPREIENAYENMKHAISIYQKESINRNLNKNHSGYRHIDFEKFESGQIEGLPVWYKGEGSELCFSPACIGRFTYNSTMEDLAPAHKPCENPAHLCKACELFGMIRQNKDDSSKDDAAGFGSHIRFGDAKLINPFDPEVVEKQLEYITLAELSSPKPSYLPFYLNATDYTKGYDGDGATIKGRKFYWHHLPTMTTKQKKGERNATMEVLKNPAEFEFSVYFDDITNKQLRELEYVLCLGENKKDGDLCYKIGHGKPLGYGSAKIYVVTEEIRNFEEGRYGIDTQNPVAISGDKVPELVKGWPDTLNTILSCSFIGKRSVRYPFVDNATVEKDKKNIEKIDRNALASHKWFSENYKFGWSKPNMVLPDTPVSDDESSSKEAIDITLPAIMLTDIVDDNDVSCLGSKTGINYSNDNIVQEKELKKGEVISVTLTNIKPDDKKENFYFGYFEYNGIKGSVQCIPYESKDERHIEVQILSPKTQSGRIFAQYVKKRS